MSRRNNRSKTCFCLPGSEPAECWCHTLFIKDALWSFPVNTLSVSGMHQYTHNFWQIYYVSIFSKVSASNKRLLSQCCCFITMWTEYFVSKIDNLSQKPLRWLELYHLQCKVFFCSRQCEMLCHVLSLLQIQSNAGGFLCWFKMPAISQVNLGTKLISHRS